MKDKVYSIFPSSYLILSGFLIFLKFVSVVQTSETLIFGISFSVISPFYLYFSFEREEKGGLIISTFLFLLGVILLAVYFFEILDVIPIILPSVFFIAGGIFLMMFVDNPKVKAFLVSTIVLFMLVVFTLLAPNLTFINILNHTSFTILNYWEILLIFLGLGMLVG
jgi:hypothetical protein